MSTVTSTRQQKRESNMCELKGYALAALMSLPCTRQIADKFRFATLC